MKKSRHIFLKLIIFLILIIGMHPWFLWGVDKNYLSFIIFLCSIMSLVFADDIFEFNLYKVWPMVLLLIVAILYSKGLEFKGFIALLASFVPYMILIFTKKEINGDILRFCIKGFSILLIPSIFAYLASSFITLPSFGQINHRSSEQYVFENYFIFIDYVRPSNEVVRRFSSVFLEPGYLGTCTAFLLFADNYNFKKRENQIILVALLLSLSLAGIVTFYIGFIFNKLTLYKTLKSRLRFLIIMAIIFIAFFNVVQEYNDGVNSINLTLFDKIEKQSEIGIKGESRISESTNDEFGEFIASDFFWFGLDRNQFKSYLEGELILGAGYAIYLLQNGFVSVLVFFLFYLSIAARSLDRIKSYIFLFLIILTFLQAAYPESGSWLIPYLLGISNFDLEKKIDMDRLNSIRVDELKLS